MYIYIYILLHKSLYVKSEIIQQSLRPGHRSRSVSYTHLDVYKRQVLANMPLKCTKKLTESDQISYRFHTTPLMSTYLVAWAVGEYDYIESETEKSIYPTIENYNTQDGTSSGCGKLPVKVYTAKGKAQQGKFALDVAKRVIDFFSESFEIPYPLPKLDLLCVETYSHNAMENFSLITFRPVSYTHLDVYKRQL